MLRCITTTARASLTDPLEPVHDLFSSKVIAHKPHAPPHAALFYAAALALLPLETSTIFSRDKISLFVARPDKVDDHLRDQ